MNKLFTLTLSILVRASVLFFIHLPASAATPKEAIREFTLDEHNIYPIPVSLENVTTISFPGPISALDGAALTVDGKAPAKFQLAYKPGNYFFSVRCIVKGVTTNLNVVWNRKTYVLELAESKQPILSAIFKVDKDSGKPDRNTVVTPARLLGLLDKAKAYPFLKEHHPDSVGEVKFEQPGNIMEYPDFNVTIAEVFRFDPQDTLVFRLLLKNRTDREIYYDPQGFSIRVGDRVYPQSLADASGVIPPDAELPAYFCVTGTPSGGRNDLSIKNEFTVLVSQLNQDGSAK